MRSSGLGGCNRKVVGGFLLVCFVWGFSGASGTPQADQRGRIPTP